MVLPPDSIAAIVMVPRRHLPRTADGVRRRVTVFSEGTIAAEALGPRDRRRNVRTWASAVVIAGTLHALAAIGARQGASHQDRAPKATAAITVEHVVELTDPKPPEEAAPPQPPPSIKAPRVRKAPPEPHAPQQSAPAQAGQVIASEATAEPVDFTTFDIASGSGSTYAGGVTASSGTATHPIHDGAARPGVDDGPAAGGPSRARGVRLPARNWRCPWPPQAQTLGIDEQVVVLRAEVDAQGQATSVRLIDDPGHGFGAAAVDCARQARFEPARDHDGRPHATTSPPIRVRFTR